MLLSIFRGKRLGFLVAVASIVISFFVLAACVHKIREIKLIEAVQAGNTPLVKTLLSKGVSADTRDDMGRTPLILAAQRRDHEIMYLLLKAGADINSRDRGGLHGLELCSTERLHGYGWVSGDGRRTVGKG